MSDRSSASEAVPVGESAVEVERPSRGPLALALVLCSAFIMANIVIDIAYTVIDPRVRYERQRLG